MNEIVAGQLHANTINIQDTQAARIVELERQVDGMGLVIHGLRSRVEGLVEKLDEAHTLSVICQALLAHYVESHWTPIAGLMEQIGSYAACQLVTGSPPHEPCDLSDAGVIFKGMDGSSSSSSLPSLESISSSSIDSVYYSPPVIAHDFRTTFLLCLYILLDSFTFKPPHSFISHHTSRQPRSHSTTQGD